MCVKQGRSQSKVDFNQNKMRANQNLLYMFESHSFKLNFLKLFEEIQPLVHSTRQDFNTNVVDIFAYEFSVSFTSEL